MTESSVRLPSESMSFSSAAGGGVRVVSILAWLQGRRKSRIDQDLGAGLGSIGGAVVEICSEQS